MKKTSRLFNALRSSLLVTSVLVTGLASAPATAQETFKVGLVAFLSGPAAEKFGILLANGAKLTIDALNKGQVPAPYDKTGIGGMPIEVVLVDEAGPTTAQVQEFRNLVERGKVDAVVGYTGSGNCLAIAPVADELKVFTIIHSCGTPRLFEENSYRYVFRSGAHGAMDNVALARYLKSTGAAVKTFAGINPDYAYGRDSWNEFRESMGQLYPEAKITGELFPKFGATQFGSETSVLLRSKPDVVQSALWGGDLEAFVLQSRPRGLFSETQVLLTTGDDTTVKLGSKVPDGVIISARGSNGIMAEPGPLHDWFFDLSKKTYGYTPTQADYRGAQAILGLKAAAEKAMAADGGKKPTAEKLAAAMKSLSFPTPSGLIEMAIGNGHQAIQHTTIGRSKRDEAKGETTIVDQVRFPARCVNPPDGVKTIDWIKSGFKGAQCS